MSAFVSTPQRALKWSPFDRMRNKKRRDAKYYCRIDVSGLIGIFFFFFIMFVLSAPPYHDMPVDLVKSWHSSLVPSAVREDAMKVSVTRDGRVYFGSRQVSLAELPNRIVEALRSGSENRVFLLVDARARYSDVVTALESVQRARVRRVTFLTEALQR
jgi:biopolymer transport protein ExbD